MRRLSSAINQLMKTLAPRASLFPLFPLARARYALPSPSLYPDSLLHFFYMRATRGATFHVDPKTQGEDLRKLRCATCAARISAEKKGGGGL